MSISNIVVFAMLYHYGWRRVGFWGMVLVFYWFINWGIKI